MGDISRITVKVSGAKQYSRAFETIGIEADDLSDPLKESGQIIQKAVGDQFLTEGARSGRAWHPLSASYAAWKEEHFPGRPMLVQQGDLRREALDRNAIHVTPKRMVYKINDKKGIWHQKGLGHNPARPLVNTTLGDRRQIDRAFANWINGLRRGQGIGGSERRAA